MTLLNGCDKRPTMNEHCDICEAELKHGIGYHCCERCLNEIERLREALRFFGSIVHQSNGVEGYHLNGDIAAWEELEGFDEAYETCRALEADDE